MGTSFRGRIKNFDEGKGVGSIAADDGKKIFFHKSALKSGSPAPDAQVEGHYEQGDRGLRATSVRVLAPPASAPSAAPAKVQIKYYSDNEKKHMRPEMLCEEARRTAEKFVVEKLNSSQLRRFFEEVRYLEKIVATRGFEAAMPLIRMLAAKAHYARGRGRIGNEFKDYLSNNARAIEDEADFKAFVKAFEAVVGYFYYLNPKKG